MKIFALYLLLGASLVFSSCVKCYECECETETTVDVNGSTTVRTSTIIIEECTTKEEIKNIEDEGCICQVQ